MMRPRFASSVVAVLVLWVSAPGSPHELAAEPSSSTSTNGLTFVQNEGQWTGTYSQDVRCVAKATPGNLLITDDGVVFQTIRTSFSTGGGRLEIDAPGDDGARRNKPQSVRNTVVEFPAKLQACRPTGGDHVVRFIKKGFNRVVASGRHVELVFRDCTVRVSASADGIRFDCLAGCDNPACETFRAEGREQGLAWVRGDAVGTARQGLEPSVLWSTLFSGTVRDYFWNHFPAPDGSGIITHGDAESPDFPTTPGVFDDTPQNGFGMPDIQVAKFSNDGSTLLWATVVGSPGTDFSSKGAATLDADGNIVVGGSTQNDAFPTTPGGHQPAYRGSGDGFVFKLKSDGSDLLWSTYLGGTAEDRVRVVDVDRDGNVHFSGSTRSDDFADRGQLSMPGGDWDSVVGSLSADGDRLRHWRTLGGVGIDFGRGVRVLFDDTILAVGWTRDARGWMSPIGTGYQQPFSGEEGLADTYLAVLSPDLVEMKYFTFYGGTSHDYVEDVAVLGEDIFLIGSTLSADLPLFGSPYQAGYAGFRDIMYSSWERTTNGMKLDDSHYLGGGFVDSGRAIAVDETFVYLGGSSFGSGIPIVGDAVQDEVVDLNEGYFAVLRTADSELVYASFIGGSDHDQINDITPLDRNSVLVSGYTFRETEAPVGDFPTTSGAHQTTMNGLNSGFLSSIRWNTGGRGPQPGGRFSLRELEYPAYRLYDVSGRWVREITGYTDLLRLGAGVYFLRADESGPQPERVRVTLVRGGVAGYRAGK